MRYLVFADIHANLAAFQAVLAAAGRVDGYIFLGDVVSYGPEPQACVELLQALAPFAVAGNHDRTWQESCPGTAVLATGMNGRPGSWMPRPWIIWRGCRTAWSLIWPARVSFCSMM